MATKPEHCDSNLHVTDRQVSTNNCSPLATSFTMNGVQQTQTWPLLANAAPALLQSYAKLAFPDLDPQAAAQLLGAAASAEAQSSPRMPLAPPPFAVPPMFIGASAPVAPPFGVLAPHLMQQPLAAPETNSVIIPPGTQLDASTFAAMSAAASAYQQMNGVAAACPFDFGGGARRKNATRETTSTLKAWLHEHRKNPYPTKAEKIMLAILTRMSLTQVSTWFANARRRLKKENKMNSWSSSQARGVEGRDGGAKQASGAPGSDSACDDSDNADFDTESIDIDGECASDGEAGTCQFNSQPTGVDANAVTLDHPAFRQRSSHGADGNAAPPAAPAPAEQAGPRASGAEGTPARPAADKAKIWSLVDTATGSTPASPPNTIDTRMSLPDGVPAAQCQEFLKQLLALSSKMQPLAPGDASGVLGLRPEALANANAANMHGDPLANMAALYPLYLSMTKHSGSA